jgi:hypothetical protein
MKAGMLLLVFALLAGCTKVPLGSLWSLRQFDVETFDPATLRVAVYLPSTYDLDRDALRIEAKIRRAADAPEQVEHFSMRPSSDRADRVGLPSAPQAEGRWIVLRFDAAEAKRVRALRERLQAMKGQASQGGSLAIGASPRLCHTGGAPQGTPRVSAALFWSGERGWVMLLVGADLEALRGSMSEQPDLPRC